MNHLKQIAAKLDEYKLDAMLITSDPGEYYATGFHGEGMVIVTKDESRYFTDSRYIEAAGNLVTGAAITMTDRNKNFMVLAEQAVRELGIQQMGFEDGYVTVASYNQYSKLPCELVPAQSLVNNLRAAMAAVRPDRVVVMPAGTPPHKAASALLTLPSPHAHPWGTLRRLTGAQPEARSRGQKPGRCALPPR